MPCKHAPGDDVDRILAVLNEYGNNIAALTTLADALDAWDRPDVGEPRGNARFIASMIRNLLAVQNVEGVILPPPVDCISLDGRKHALAEAINTTMDMVVNYQDVLEDSLAAEDVVTKAAQLAKMILGQPV